MTDNTTNTTDDKEQLLDRLWTATVRGLLNALETADTEARASLFAAASRFLSDNGFNALTRRNPAKALEQLAGMDLPFVNGEDAPTPTRGRLPYG